MNDATIIAAVVAALFLIVFVRIALTLKDISESLARIAGGPQPQVKVDVSLPRTEAAPQVEQEPDETEIAAVIAVAKAALEGAL